MARTDLGKQTLVENKMLMLLIEGLRNTLAWKVQGIDFARKLLRCVYHAMLPAPSGACVGDGGVRRLHGLGVARKPQDQQLHRCIEE